MRVGGGPWSYGQIITSFLDIDGKITSIGNSSFQNQTNLKNIYFPNIVSTGTLTFYSAPIKYKYFNNVADLGIRNLHFSLSGQRLYSPLDVPVSTSSGNNNMFLDRLPTLNFTHQPPTKLSIRFTRWRYSGIIKCWWFGIRTLQTPHRHLILQI